ncbi:TPA: type VI secretion system amidase effector protein Tae4 [Enterobacter ludwigii]|nr:type VI secretion system amidase effector protein Tae4 [Enterobacter ludwigii]
MSAMRPAFGAAWNRFKEVNVNVGQVGKLLGGKVQHNIDAGIFKNACPIRMSYVLNYCGIPIPSNSKYATVTGNDKKRYMFRVKDMIAFLPTVLGHADMSVASSTPAQFSGKQGIIIFTGHGWRDATGHVTLWNGNICSDDCHFLGSPGNGSFIPTNATFWSLK